jgi:uncharacterized protein YjbI with pentapeptide repeats
VSKPESDGQSGGVVPTNPSAALSDKTDVTGQIYDRFTSSEGSTCQSLLQGTIFRRCHFSRWNFSRSDFSAVAFEACIFEDCDFSSAEFRSIEVSETKFIRCTFDDGLVQMSQFLNCVFLSCQMLRQTFQENTLSECILDEVNFKKSNLSNCKFVRTEFRRTDLSDCTALYHIFDHCRFTDCGLNPELVGLSFGLTLQNLAEIRLVWLGDPISSSSNKPEEIAHDLAVTFHQREWGLSVPILELNFGLTLPLRGMITIFQAITKMVTSKQLVNGADIRFVATIVERLSQMGRLPFLAIVRGLDLAVELSQLRGGSTEPIVRPLYHALKDAETSELGALSELQQYLSVIAAAPDLVIGFVFDERPLYPLGPWLEALATAFGLPRPEFKACRTGSYVEMFTMTPLLLGSVAASLSMVERIVDRVIILRAKAQILTAKKMPAAIRARALRPATDASPQFLQQLRKTVDVLTSSDQGAELVAPTTEFASRLQRIEVTPPPSPEGIVPAI